MAMNANAPAKTPVLWNAEQSCQQDEVSGLQKKIQPLAGQHPPRIARERTRPQALNLVSQQSHRHLNQRIHERFSESLSEELSGAVAGFRLEKALLRNASFALFRASFIGRHKPKERGEHSNEQSNGCGNGNNEDVLGTSAVCRWNGDRQSE